MLINGFEHIPFDFDKSNSNESLLKSQEFLNNIKSRRSLRFFSDEDIPIEVIENIISSAGQAPSGANKQPWLFCVVRDSSLKKEIRKQAEIEERINYSSRMSEEWLRELEPIGTNENKEFLEEAPYLIVVFRKILDENKTKNYYTNESIGIACGFLIAAIHFAGLVTLTHTPSPMKFLSKILGRPSNERAFLLLPVGYPKIGATVPNIERKALEEIMEKY